MELLPTNTFRGIRESSLVSLGICGMGKRMGADCGWRENTATTSSGEESKEPEAGL